MNPEDLLEPLATIVVPLMQAAAETYAIWKLNRRFEKYVSRLVRRESDWRGWAWGAVEPHQDSLIRNVTRVLGPCGGKRRRDRKSFAYRLVASAYWSCVQEYEGADITEQEWVSIVDQQVHLQVLKVLASEPNWRFESARGE